MDYVERPRIDVISPGLYRPLVFLALLTFLNACATSPNATSPTPSCRKGERPAITESLYFGRNKPVGTVSPEEWTAFVNRVVTPAFPEGLTSWAASGQWRLGDGTIDREDSYVLQVVHDQTDGRDSTIQQIVAKYKQEFHQEAVMRIRSSACVSY
ncbi:hypothetical protein W02_41260 [Nitrospira sp. KM1]|uniref:DUF3574 domain-containing protein n=1 Tax=Nitrospira sp. KM1 TaxID=1936990 RepID=UPI0013A73EE5|nr:DUF3574 domain-containing protein [Nitrospira sp. KM1]BCA56986.1 hypothetical protein W02_41260 [Nitrospira sp. KM1]